jgi:hypothetical protein
MNFRYASGNKPSSPKPSRGVCDRCGQTWKRHELRKESTGAKGSPDNRWSGLLTCPSCFDEIHPLSKLPFMIQAKLPDAEALYLPRPDNYDYIVAYPVLYSIPTAIFKPVPLSLQQGFTGNIIGTGVFPGLTVSANPPVGITVNSITLVSETRVMLNITISLTCSVGNNILYVVMGDDELSNGQNLGGVINVMAGDPIFGEGEFGGIEFGGPV